MSLPTLTIRETDEGERRWFCGGGLHVWKATAAESGGAFILFEDRLEGGKMTPLHIHPDAEETFCMLEGEIRLHVDGEERLLGAGGVALVPRGVPHAFMVTSAVARMWCLQTPGTGEAFYRQASDPAADGSEAPAPDFDRVRDAAMATGAIVIQGPPPFADLGAGSSSALG